MPTVAERMLVLLRLYPEQPIDFLAHAEDVGLGSRNAQQLKKSVKVHISYARKHLELDEEIVSFQGNSRRDFPCVYMLRVL